MRVGITADHRGYELKNKLLLNLRKDYEMVDFGCSNSESVDYPDYAFRLAESVAKGEIDYGIAICGSGIGISIACNKVKGIRAARVVSLDDVMETRADNDANIICLSEKFSLEEASSFVRAFLTTPFSNEKRHIRRIHKIRDYEDKNYEC